MSEFKKQTRVEYRRAMILRFLIGVLGLLALLTVSAFMVRAAWRMYGKFSTAVDGREVAEKDLSRAKEQYDALTLRVDTMKTDRGVDGEIRARFGVARPGEGEIQIVRDTNASTTLKSPPSGNFFVRMFRALFVW